MPCLRRLQREEGPSSHVFMTERDGPMTPKAFHALFGRIGERAKMPFPVDPHMLRHGCGYALANAGCDTRALQAVKVKRAWGQQPAMPVIGFLHHTSPDLAGSLRTAFAQGLKQTGFIEGQNVRIEYRWAENHFERLPELAADLVRREVAIIFT